VTAILHIAARQYFDGWQAVDDPLQPFAFRRKSPVLSMASSRTTVILILSVAIAACASGQIDAESEVPKIVEIFACGDYCPGPQEKYLKRVYDGVTDEKECRTLGGKIYTWIGWQQQTVCEVK
jgi:hypothetical protein